MSRNLTVANLIDRAARKYGDKLFAVGEEPVKSDYLPEGHDGLHFTCNDALEITNLFAAAMRGKLGVGTGDRIAVVLTNVPEMGTIFTEKDLRRRLEEEQTVNHPSLTEGACKSPWLTRGQGHLRR